MSAIDKLNGVEAKAVHLAVHGHVTDELPNARVFRVLSQNRNHTYLVTLYDGGSKCTCPAGRGHHPARCSHVIATELSLAMDAETERAAA